MKIICTVVIIAFILCVIFCLIVITPYVFWFSFRKCSMCGHTMLYRGYRERTDEGYHYFHCKKCGHWEKVTKAQTLHELGILHEED